MPQQQLHSEICKGVFFMILVDAEWELVKFHKSVNTKFQLYNVITNEWCESLLIVVQIIMYCKTFCTLKIKTLQILYMQPCCRLSKLHGDNDQVRQGRSG